jgi:hypothetical protein
MRQSQHCQSLLCSSMSFEILKSQSSTLDKVDGDCTFFTPEILESIVLLNEHCTFGHRGIGQLT